MKYLNQPLPHLQALSSLLELPLTFMDLETTGRPHEKYFGIMEIGVIQIEPDKIIEKSSLLDPKMKIPPHIVEITGINDSMVKGKPDFNLLVKYCTKIANEHILMGYNSKSFDSKCLEKMFLKNGSMLTYKNQIDVYHIFQRCKKQFLESMSRSGTLVEACRTYNILLPGKAHRAAYDIALTVLLAEKLLELYGLGIINKDVLKLDSKTSKSNYYQHLVKNKIKAIG